VHKIQKRKTMDDTKIKQQIVDKIKEATNILVTVSDDPSVDALSAALGLSLLIDKLDKHATAVFSGKVPPAISFLEPEKTFEDTTDSLRDFIIALDKEKADHLRVKPEGDVVKIYVTPYRTTITADDLEFSQGDYNVELVIALGVDVQEHLDGALDAHGKILHDASVVTITAGEQVSNLGSIDWHDDKASSLSEMVSGLAELIRKDKADKKLVDKQIATAFLTGIVAETDRFSNLRTTPKSMTAAATLMAAGADPQLIATQLQANDDEEETGNDDPDDTPDEPNDGPDAPDDTPLEDSEPDDDGVLTIDHKPHVIAGETLEQMDKRVKAEEQREAEREAEKELAEEQAPKEKPKKAPKHKAASHTKAAAVPDPVRVPVPAVEPIATPEVPTANGVSDVHATSMSALEEEEPSFGGTLNATTGEAEEDNRQELESDQNKTILSHKYIGSPQGAPLSAGDDADTDGDIINPLTQPSTDGQIHSAYAFDDQHAHEQVIQPLEESTDPVVAPLVNEAPTVAAPPIVPPAPIGPAELGLPLPPAVPDFTSSVAPLSQDVPPVSAPVASAYAVEEPVSLDDTPERLGDIFPDPAPAPTAPASNDPGQFKIPGQS